MFIVISRFGLLRTVGRRVDVLKQTGPYGMTRNPQIVACAVAVFGGVLIWPAWHTLGWVVIFAIIAHLMVLTEAAHLRAVFGEEYRRDCARVPRYLGTLHHPRFPFAAPKQDHPGDAEQ